MPNECPKCQTNNPEDSKFCKECATPLPSGEAQSSFTRTLETPVESLTRGTLFANRYEIIEEFGKGGMGAVYRVEDTKAKEEIALKLIRPEIASDQKTIDRFRNELTTARKISHRNVCRMFDLGEAEGIHYITMEYVSGEDLKNLISRIGRMPIGKALDISSQLCAGLSEAHGLGIVHRDLKPGNIMIDQAGNAKIMDFGIARSGQASKITGTGVIIGTPEYMSPEQAEAEDLDQRSDIYSLGIILYEMVTGQVPFSGKSGLSVAMKQKGELPRDPREFNPQIPDNLSELILKCLEKDREDRFTTVEELNYALDEIGRLLPATHTPVIHKKPQTSREVTVTFSPRKLLIPALVLGILVTAVVLAVWQPWSNTEEAVGPKIENSIAIISFENLTGDDAFNDLCKAVPNMLITNLENTGFYYVVPWERMRDILKQVGKADAEFIDSDRGFELCRREGVQSLVTGSITRAGEMFAVNVKVIDVETKNLINSANSRGEGVDSIIRVQIDELSREISRSTGVSPLRIESTSFDAMDVMTDSMEAYTYYLEGVENKYYWDRARESLEMAVKLDPKFASAYSSLSGAYDSSGDNEARDEALKRAKSLSGKASEKERLYIEAQYAITIERNREKYFQILKQINDKFPREKNVHNRLGLHYYFLGLFPEAIEEFSQTIELDPNNEDALNILGYTYAKLGDPDKAIEYVERYVSLSSGKANPLDSMGEVLLILGRFEEAIAKYSEASKADPDFYQATFSEAYIHALKEDYSTAIDRVDEFISRSPGPAIAARGHFWKGFYFYWLGGISRSLEELASAEDYANQVNNRMWLGLIELLRGLIRFERGEFDESRQHLKNFYDFSPQTQTLMEPDFRAVYYMMIGFLDLSEGQVGSAKSKVKELNSILIDMNPGTRGRTRYIYDFLNGEALLAEKKVEEAIAAGESISSPPLPFMDRPHWIFYYNMPMLKDYLARAYHMMGDLDRAISEYERLVSVNPANGSRYLIHPKYHYRLAKLYEQKGWQGKAIEHLEKFLDLCKDADPGFPEVEDARRRLAGLKND